jgi:hypothetical protein
MKLGKTGFFLTCSRVFLLHRSLGHLINHQMAFYFSTKQIWQNIKLPQQKNIDVLSPSLNSDLEHNLRGRQYDHPSD